MKLAAKLVFVLLLGVFVLTGIRVHYAIVQEESEFENEMAAEVAHISMTIQETISDLGHDLAQEVTVKRVEMALTRQTGFSARFLELDELPDGLQELRNAGYGDQWIANRRPQWIHVRDGQGVVHACSYWPLSEQGKHVGWLEFSKPATEVELNKLRAIYRNIWVAAGTALLAVLLVGIVGVRMVGRPIERLVEKTRRIAAGDLSGPIHLKSRDELNELAESINDMCTQLADSQQRVHDETAARIKAMEELRHSDRLRTVGRLAAGVAHELGTPLNVVSGRAGLIASGKLSATDMTSSATTIKAETDRMTAIIRKLLDFARLSTPHRSPADLTRVAQETADLLSALAGKKQVQIDVKAAETPLSASVDVGQIQQVLTNLIMNAVQAMPAGGRVDVELSQVRAISPNEADMGETDFVCIAVKDEGTGISAQHVDQVFEPFFTTKDVGEGTGLGLSIAYGIVQEHGGWIDVASETGQGTCFYVHLPQEPPA